MSFIFLVVACGFFEWKQICAGFFIVCLYLYCRWGPIIRGGDPINRFNHDPFLCLFQAGTGILLMEDHNMLTEKLQQEN
jgi:hypothetical protein